MKKILLALAFALVLIMPTTMLHASAQTTQSYTITAGGSTFIFPLMDQWRVQYNNLYSNVKLNYQSIGSGAGIKLLEDKTVDFAASDAPLQPNEQTAAPGTVTIPESIGGITVSYNIPGIDKGMKLTGPVIAQIFMGNITMWNDPAIANLNPGLNLPPQKILIVHRSDGSGTTYAFTDYLSKVYPQWKTDVGQGKVVPWPVGTGAPGNSGVATIITKTPYSCGYVELAYVIQNNMTDAFVQNADGTAFLEPTLATVAADAAAGATALPAPDGDWSKVSIVNEPGANSYPITTLTYIFAYKDMSQVNGETQDKAQQVVNFLNWIVTGGQQYASPLLYVPLPDAMVKADQNAISMIQFAGSPVPEFGPIASLVLAIAIISIIAVSAKTGLRLAPKL
jgi:phosphate transport system substrate-binding protein